MINLILRHYRSCFATFRLAKVVKIREPSNSQSFFANYPPISRFCKYYLLNIRAARSTPATRMSISSNVL